jgi:K(+)-stimulated pyrophosphate-energized sodium pump
MISNIFWLAPVSSIIALVFAWIFFKSMIKRSEGTDKMIDIASSVREGADAYLKRQYQVIAYTVIVLMILFTILAILNIQNFFVPVTFLTGALGSALAGYLGMKTATNASARTANSCRESLNSGLKVAFRSGAVMGLMVVGIGLLLISAWFVFLDKVIYTAANMANGLDIFGIEVIRAGTTERQKLVEITSIMLTFGIGASTQALFARVGGGIYTKAADVGADIAGKVEAGISEDDPRNPGTIADNVGDNVGDVAGMGADLFESYMGSILATATLGAAIPASVAGLTQINAVVAPFIVAGLGILCSIIGIFLVKAKESATQDQLLKSLFVGTGSSSVLVLIAIAIMAATGFITWGVFGSVVSGLIAGVIIGQGTEYFTSAKYNPTRRLSEEAKTGPASTIIEGIALGMFSSWLPVVVIVGGILAAYGFAGGFQNFSMGVYGIGFAAVGMLSTLGITLATDAFGPIADNAGGNAEMAELDPEVRDKTDALDALGNTTAATGKGFAIGSAALTALALFTSYIGQVRLWITKLARASADGIKEVGNIVFYVGNEAPEVAGKAIAIGSAKVDHLIEAFQLNLYNPILLGGIFLGAMMAFLFCAMTMRAVGRTASKMIEEIRRQLREMPGILKGETKPDNKQCVSISTEAALKEMVVPSLLAIFVPVIVGVFFGVAGVIGLLTGALTAGFTLAIMLNNAGGAWDNAKKYIEEGHHGGKGSDAHKAGVVGDTVGDPFKDTSGPSLNILIKLMSMVSVVMAGLTMATSIF